MALKSRRRAAFWEKRRRSSRTHSVYLKQKKLVTNYLVEECRSQEEKQDGEQRGEGGPGVEIMCRLACPLQNSCSRPQSNMATSRSIRPSTNPPGWGLNLLLIELVKTGRHRLKRLQPTTPNVSGWSISVFCSCFCIRFSTRPPIICHVPVSPKYI